MGGHGGLNILPQKKWNVYRADRQYQVKYDEHRDIEEKLSKRARDEKAKVCDSLVKLRRKRLEQIQDDVIASDDGENDKKAGPEIKKPDSGHVNLFKEAQEENEKLTRQRREYLIKSGCYVYNAQSKGPKSVNIYTSDDSTILVPDFKREATPWYMKPRRDDDDDDRITLKMPCARRKMSGRR